MALHFKEPLHILPGGIQTLKGEPFANSGAFRVSIVKMSPNIVVKISRYSAVLNSPNIKDRIPLIGVDTPITLNYGDKIWLEIYYDRNLVPVFSIINSGPKWLAKVDNGTGIVPVYPEELEFISKKDLSAKINDVFNVVGTTIPGIKTKALQEIDTEYSAGFISEEMKNESQSVINASFQAVSENILKYKQNMNQFFSSSPNLTFKRLFRTYTLIAYTTKNLDPNLDGIIARPPNVGNPQQNGVNTATDDSAFKIVQALTTDLLLADICYQNRFAAKLPIPYHRPVYYYVHNGKNEEDATTL